MATSWDGGAQYATIGEMPKEFDLVAKATVWETAGAVCSLSGATAVLLRLATPFPG